MSTKSLLKFNERICLIPIALCIGLKVAVEDDKQFETELFIFENCSTVARGGQMVL